MDNAAFHKSKKTKELIESVGCKVIFLPHGCIYKRVAVRCNAYRWK
ncbi:hypothetical protein [Orientia tsutsugamushi]|nr:hypothetical protein [Orientia tsutsugamushi]